jgi:hypothetical protein
MLDLILENKTGFRTTLPFEIFDTRGNLFYSDSFCNTIKEGKALLFNMPAGIYKYNGSFIKLDQPVPSINIVLPPPERIMKNKRYEIVFGDNPNKCSIFYDSGVILFDNSLLNKPLYIKYGIYFHELGHRFYKTESKADLYATKKMLDYGFNPSQIGLVQLTTLTNRPESFERKIKTVNAVTKKL